MPFTWLFSDTSLNEHIFNDICFDGLNSEIIIIQCCRRKWREQEHILLFIIFMSSLDQIAGEKQGAVINKGVSLST